MNLKQSNILKKTLPALLLISVLANGLTPSGSHAQSFTHADTVRGSITKERAWWDVVMYDLHVKPDISRFSIQGYNTITYKVLKAYNLMQIDLQEPMIIDSIIKDKKSLTYTQQGNAWYVTIPSSTSTQKLQQLTVYYHGIPKPALNAPWDGGIDWKRDSLGNPWISTACQGLGASVWYPNKDHQGDEPDSVRISVTVPDTLMDVSNGRLRSVQPDGEGYKTYEWFVSNPINNYDVSMNIGKYAHWSDTLAGENGTLDLNFYVLEYNLEKAKTHFAANVKPMLRCFEYWFGPYPFYKDGYKLVETHHLGMEHQSAVAYGNHFQNGYLGRDLSHTGWGLKWDFIIVHESGHEWFGNNITSKDIADMWIHESFTNYSETVFTNCEYGRQAASEYCIGTRKNVANDKPIIGHYGVNEEGSGDMYYKGGNMIHTIRAIINDDVKFRSLLRGLNKTFYHQTVTTQQIEQYINKSAGINLDKVFDQYLRTTKIPVVEYKFTAKDNQTTLQYHWTDCVDGFDMPLRIALPDGGTQLLKATIKPQTITLPYTIDQFRKDSSLVVPEYYVKTKELN